MCYMLVVSLYGPPRLWEGMGHNGAAPSVWWKNSLSQQLPLGPSSYKIYCSEGIPVITQLKVAIWVLINLYESALSLCAPRKKLQPPRQREAGKELGEMLTPFISCCQPGSGSFPPTHTPFEDETKESMLISNSNKEERLLSGSSRLRALPDPAKYQNADEGKTDHHLCWKWLSSILHILSGCLGRRKMMVCWGKLILHLRYHCDYFLVREVRGFSTLNGILRGKNWKNSSILSMRKKGKERPGNHEMQNRSWTHLDPSYPITTHVLSYPSREVKP